MRKKHYFEENESILENGGNSDKGKLSKISKKLIYHLEHIYQLKH